MILDGAPTAVGTGLCGERMPMSVAIAPGWKDEAVTPVPCARRASSRVKRTVASFDAAYAPWEPYGRWDLCSEDHKVLVRAADFDLHDGQPGAQVGGRGAIPRLEIERSLRAPLNRVSTLQPPADHGPHALVCTSP